MAINSTLCDPDQVSYESVTYADSYFASHQESDIWSGLTTAQKESSLIQASDVLDQSRYFRSTGGKYVYDGPWEQVFNMPFSDHDTYSGTATGGSTTTVVCSDLTVVDTYRDDLFNAGTVRMTSGTNIYHLRKISDFVVSTGTITVETAFNSSIVAGDEFVIISPLARNIRRAVCEMALEIVKGNWDQSINGAVMDGGPIPSNLLPARVLWLLGAQCRNAVATVRG
jgi:hypothetical protein